MKMAATIAAGCIAAFLLLGLVLNLMDPEVRSPGPVVVMYVALVGLVLAAGVRIDKWRARR